MSNGKKQHVSMRGVAINMDVLRSANPDQPALNAGSGLKMNARGDILGLGGSVAISRDQIVRDYYKANPNGVKQVSLKSPMPDAFETPSEAIARMTAAVEEAPAVELPDGALMDRRSARKLIDKKD